MPHDLWLIRHGETEWSLSGAHTGRTDIPLTEEGRKKAAALARPLSRHHFAKVLTSPLQRAHETCRLAGFGDVAEPDADLMEWDYGDYEGRTSAQIQQEVPNWSIWSQGVPRGETIEQVAARASRVIERAVQADGDVALFAHGHILRILTACWLGQPPVGGRLYALGTATMSTLGYERVTRVITRWNLSAAE